MIPQTGQKLSTKYTYYPIISRSKANQAMGFSQLLIAYELFFFKNHAENKIARLVPDLFFFFKKAFHKEKATAQHFNFNVFWYISAWACNKKQLLYHFRLNPRICSSLIFYKRVRNYLSHHILCMIFQEKYLSCCLD